ncbi:MAG: ZIP family metal transporter [Bacteroidales bacterium]|nr:ZIP family metal transporter [Bacteroidales bacterium]
MMQVWLSAAGLCGATIIGSILGFFFKELPHKLNDAVLGFCAGIMLASSTVGLILPAFSGTPHWWWVALGVIAGAVFLNLLDFVTPHLHTITGLDPELHRNNPSLNRVLLFVMAVALHKFPEGLAAGVSVSGAEAGISGWTVSLGIAIQNIPEGMVIIAPLLLEGVSSLRTFLIAITIALLEVAGVWAGFGMGEVSKLMLPVMLGFGGGAMLYVVSDEMIPETHAHGYQKQATYALLVGFMSLLILEKLFA